ncbi:trans-aconitate 2-methyltransferase [Paractinoplanes atraurantiacus]|uniref:Trans-aconitate 2-methyltransferase n=1 Tax=Paractinoplanes atraurantiacus TaxID=1036182 RepID=A0A285JI50_9ACTN|nr:trans-aconitate 2-methyltransferase [Actinoplanes atraurantiacus]SNY59935.1 trans-aconitate 2-methyltransferase [Actinoplanes atraurantiacus]
MWDPAVYSRYGAERSRPFFDLVTRVGASSPRAVVDLGCGPGELTLSLAERWPSARLTGIDSSPEMIEKARAQAGVTPSPEASGEARAHARPARFEIGDVRDYRPAEDVDVLVTNATLQWVPGHQDLLARWAGELPAGAWLAMQVPGNFQAPSHRLLREVGRRYGLGDVLREAPVDDPVDYAGLLVAAGADVDAWETTYVHLLPVNEDEHPVLRWMEGTALRPVKAALDENAWQSFRADLARELAGAYPAAGGHVAFPFRRVFVVARTAR